MIDVSNGVAVLDTADTPDTVNDLLRTVATRRSGTLSPSIYETARLVSAAPWLPGHQARVEFLLDHQRPDGGWGLPGAYGLVPTLSATEALLATQLASPTPTGAPRRAVRRDLAEAVTGAAGRGVARCRRLLGTLRAEELPDTPAIEVIVPYLVSLLRERGAHLSLPPGLDDGLLQAVRVMLVDRTPVHTKILHSLEVSHDLAVGARGGPRHLDGPVGASPAATAAWLGGRPADPAYPPYAYLRSVAAAGPVPSVLPITAFERAWVVNSFAQAGIAFTAPKRLVRDMLATVGPHGVAGGTGLPTDADTTAFTLAALANLGQPVRVGVLRRFDLGTHFCTWAGERTASPTTNAHVLAALAHAGGRRTGWRDSAMERAAAWLIDQQNGDGAWDDKWHASPYYATMCVVMALRDFGSLGPPPRDVEKTIELAVGWVLTTQRRDGSWGRFAGTAEETAYALQILLYRTDVDQPARNAAVRGYRFLQAARDEEPLPLWHDKDLYAPTFVVRAAILAALHLAGSRLGEVAARSRPARRG